MAGLCEGGNEPPGSLKASNTTVTQLRHSFVITSFRKIIEYLRFSIASGAAERTVRKNSPQYVFPNSSHSCRYRAYRDVINDIIPFHHIFKFTLIETKTDHNQRIIRNKQHSIAFERNEFTRVDLN
ncbi:hypothetical protein ANN_27370 [Periplaneta americana]|uniref:Uncharacterized protein n=1 Tax=Periplaneta americana TaxID=6978 RepID=A0ABQ8RXZ9_PERAM|nr:hypothetical protein ANN_27370 [Periplaneta americana]